MSALIQSTTRIPPIGGAGYAALSLLLLTSVHHVYGAIIYETPWRMHILYAAVPAAIVIVAALRVRARGPGTALGTWSGRLAALLIIGFPVGLIGFYEGA